jgi:hypothetical protein
VLRPTRAAANEREVVRRLRTWFSSDEFTSLLASGVAAMLSVTGPLTGEELAGRLHPLYDRLPAGARFQADPGSGDLIADESCDPVQLRPDHLPLEHRNREAEHPRSANFDVALLIATTNLSLWSG